MPKTSISPSENSEEPQPKRQLTEVEKARIERNRLKALHIRQAKLVSHPGAKL